MRGLFSARVPRYLFARVRRVLLSEPTHMVEEGEEQENEKEDEREDEREDGQQRVEGRVHSSRSSSRIVTQTAADRKENFFW